MSSNGICSFPTLKGPLIGSSDKRDILQFAFSTGRVILILLASSGIFSGIKPRLTKNSGSFFFRISKNGGNSSGASFDDRTKRFFGSDSKMVGPTPHVSLFSDFDLCHVTEAGKVENYRLSEPIEGNFRCGTKISGQNRHVR